MATDFEFTFARIKESFREVLANGYEIVSCRGFVERKGQGLPEKLLVNRVDIDFSCKKARRLAEIFNELGIPATFFVRLHAPEYNPFAFENYCCLKYIRDTKHEIGYHSEIVDQAAIWNESTVDCLKRDLKLLETMLDIQVVGVASHGGMTGLNNLDFWKERSASEFGLLYEGYDRQPAFDLFHSSLYVSDSAWTYWKCYDKGVFREGDTKSLAEHSRDGHPLIYSLIHPDTYFDEHFYE